MKKSSSRKRRDFGTFEKYAKKIKKSLKKVLTKVPPSDNIYLADAQKVSTEERKFQVGFFYIKEEMSKKRILIIK